MLLEELSMVALMLGGLISVCFKRALRYREHVLKLLV